MHFRGLSAPSREQGIDVYGFGEQKTPESFRQACRRFIYTENLLPEAPTSEEPARADLRPAAATQAPSAAAPLIRKAIAQLDDDGGWVPLGRVGQRLPDPAPDFDPRTHGDRHSAASGNSVSVRVDLGARRIFQQKHPPHPPTP